MRSFLTLEAVEILLFRTLEALYFLCTLVVRLRDDVLGELLLCPLIAVLHGELVVV